MGARLRAPRAAPSPPWDTGMPPSTHTHLQQVPAGGVQLGHHIDEGRGGGVHGVGLGTAVSTRPRAAPPRPTVPPNPSPCSQAAWPWPATAPPWGCPAACGAVKGHGELWDTRGPSTALPSPPHVNTGPQKDIGRSSSAGRPRRSPGRAAAPRWPALHRDGVRPSAHPRRPAAPPGPTATCEDAASRPHVDGGGVQLGTKQHIRGSVPQCDHLHGAEGMLREGWVRPGPPGAAQQTPPHLC